MYEDEGNDGDEEEQQEEQMEEAEQDTLPTRWISLGGKELSGVRYTLRMLNTSLASRRRIQKTPNTNPKHTTHEKHTQNTYLRKLVLLMPFH